MEEVVPELTPEEARVVASLNGVTDVADVTVIGPDGVVLRHYGPGPHPGTGTEQAVHGGPAGYARYQKGAKGAGSRSGKGAKVAGSDRNHRAPVWKRDKNGVRVESDNPAFVKAAEAAVQRFIAETGYVPANYVITDDDEKFALTSYAADVRRQGKEAILERWEAESANLGGMQQPGYQVIWMNDAVAGIPADEFAVGSDEWNRTVWHELGHTAAEDIWPDLQRDQPPIPGPYGMRLSMAGYKMDDLPHEYLADTIASMVGGEPYRLDVRFGNAPAPEPMVAFMGDLKSYFAALATKALRGEPDLVDVWFTFPNGVVEVRWMTPKEADAYREVEGVRVAPMSAEAEPLTERIATILRNFVVGVQGYFERHYGPGAHPGTGTEQEVHAGGGGREKRTSAIDRITSDVRGFHDQQTDGTLRALDKDSKVIGYLDWSEFRDEVYVDMVEVREDMRRMGVATALLEKLKQEWPGEPVHLGMTTGEGTALRKGLEQAGWKFADSQQSGVIYDYPDRGIERRWPVARHLGPGPHPSGSEQTIHAGGDGGKKETKGKKKGEGERRFAGAGPRGSIPPVKQEEGDREAIRRKYGPEAADAARRYVADAAAREPTLTNLVVEMGETFGAEMQGLEDRLKGEESLARKIAAAVAEKGITADEAASDITDRIRYTMTFPAESFVDDVLAVQTEMTAAGWSQYDTKWRNYFAPGDDYDGYNTVMVNSQGQTFELQFHTPDSFDLKGEAHVLYSDYRATDRDDPNRAILFNDMRDLWTEYERPIGWERLPGVMMTPAVQAGG